MFFTSFFVFVFFFFFFFNDTATTEIYTLSLHDALPIELAATVDYLFGYDATAGVVDDWMYEQLAASYVFDASVRDFLEKSNPWALRGITERLLEAADRGLWAQPDPATLDELRRTYLATEGDLEGRAEQA